MTFPRILGHSDYFSDDGPVDGMRLVNAHSDAIEALQATDMPLPYFADGTAPADGTVEGQEWYDTDQSNLTYIWRGGAWVQPAAYDGVARGLLSGNLPNLNALVASAVIILDGDPITLGAAAPPQAQIALDRTAGYARWVYDPFDATWHSF